MLPSERPGENPEIVARVKAQRGFTVCAKRCDECLFSSKKLVDQERKENLLQSAIEGDSYFVCHKFSVGREHREDGDDYAENESQNYTQAEVCCRGFYDQYETRPIRMARAFGIVVFVDWEGKEVSNANDA